MASDSESTQLTVIVHKAALELMDGETVSMFTQALGEALRTYTKNKLAMGKNDWCWVSDVKAGEAVICVCKAEQPTKYYSAKYERDEKGAFSFEGLTEVMPQVVYVPVKQSLITKGAVEKLTVEKGFWNNVL